MRGKEEEREGKEKQKKMKTSKQTIQSKEMYKYSETFPLKKNQSQIISLVKSIKF